MYRNYSSEEIVRRVQNGGLKISGAQYVYSAEEADEKFFAVAQCVDQIISVVRHIHGIKAEISFAIVASSRPFQVTHLGGDEFVILVDQQDALTLACLCIRLQTLSPLAEKIGDKVKNESENFSGKYLLDIAKRFAFRTDGGMADLLQGASPFVYQSALWFIISHELAHISHGHIEFRKSDEIKQFTEPNDLALTMRTLEMDADSSATAAAFAAGRICIDLCVANKDFPVDVDISTFRGRCIRQIVVGMQIAIIYHDVLSTNFLPSAYPPSYSRFLTINNVLCKIFSKDDPFYGSVPEEMRQTLVDVFVNLSGHLGNLEHPIASNIRIWRPTSNEAVFQYGELGEIAGYEHIYPLLHRWARIRPYLEKLQRGGELAPASATAL